MVLERIAASLEKIASVLEGRQRDEDEAKDFAKKARAFWSKVESDKRYPSGLRDRFRDIAFQDALCSAVIEHDDPVALVHALTLPANKAFVARLNSLPDAEAVAELERFASTLSESGRVLRLMPD
jgi:hypothetical protein